MVRRGMIIALAVGWAAAWAAPAHALERLRPMGLYPAGAGPALAMLDSRIDVTVRGPIVEAVVTQRFRNPASHATEATYIFPLPADAAVSAMAIQVGSRTIRAAIEPREAAQRRYEAAIAAGVAGALLEQERPDVFTQSVSAIPAGGVVEVTLRYDAVARYSAGTWELVLPMVVGPRHVPGTASGRATTGGGRAPDTDRAPDASRVTPGGSPGAGGPTAVALHFVDPPDEVLSPTHEIGGTRRDAALTDPRSDHDAIVRWRAPAASAGWVERDGGAGYAAVVVEAAAVAARKPGLRVILAIDRSATTRGDADAVEHPLVRALCGALDAADRVRVIGSDALPWASPGDALRAIDRAWARPVPVFDLTRVLVDARPEGAAIVLISDGLVADDQAAIAAAGRLGVAVHVIGIGPAPARATLHRVAASSGGTLRYATAGDDVAALARAVLGDVASPPAPLAINWGTLGATDIEPAVLPRLGGGQAMLVLARIERAQPANARTRGEVFAFETLAPPRAVDGATTQRGPLARRWARERLEAMIAAGRDRDAIVAHATRFGLVSPYTSLVAIGSDVVVSGGIKHSVAVPVSLPSGMQWPQVRQALDADPITVPGSQVRREPTAAPEPKASPPPSRTAPPITTSPGKRGPLKKPPTPDAPRSPEADAPRSTRKDATSAGTAAAPSSVTDQAVEGASEGAKQAATDEAARRTADEAEPDRDGDAIPDAADADDEKRVHRAEQPRVSIGDTLQSLPAPAEAGESISISGSGYRAWRLSAALGGGLAIDRGARGLAALHVRLEHGGLLLLGGEAALWLVDGASAQGRGLFTVARAGIARWLELGAGLGVAFGDGAGPAASLRLRVDTPLAPLAGFLRYDAALLLSAPGNRASQAATLGIELSY